MSGPGHAPAAAVAPLDARLPRGWGLWLLVPLGVAGLAIGIGVATLLAMALCVLGMALLYERSGDLLDFRAALYFATLLFLLIPAAAIDASLAGAEYYWTSDFIPNLVVTESDLRHAETIVLAGLAGLSFPLLLWRRGSSAGTLERVERPATARIWPVYAAVTVAAIGFTLLAYGGFVRMAASIVSPVVRAEAGMQRSGIWAILLALSAVTGYYAAGRLRNRAARLLLFVPALLLALPAGSRGSLITILVFAAASLSTLQPRRPLYWMLGVVAALPVFLSLLFLLRTFALDTSLDEFSIAGLYADFAAESPMLPTFAFALHGLEQGLVGFAWAMDLLLFPLWYVPRFLWAAKPMPLDFRLNQALGLNDGEIFGTPIGLFGGLWFNFTPLLLVPVCFVLGVLLVRTYERVRADRVLRLLLLTFVVDLVRVGDLSRELVTLSIALVAVLLIRRLAVQRVAPV